MHLFYGKSFTTGDAGLQPSRRRSAPKLYVCQTEPLLAWVRAGQRKERARAGKLPPQSRVQVERGGETFSPEASQTAGRLAGETSGRAEECVTASAPTTGQEDVASALTRLTRRLSPRAPTGRAELSFGMRQLSRLQESRLPKFWEPYGCSHLVLYMD